QETRTRAKTAGPASYPPLAPETLYLERDEWEAIVGARPLHLVTPFHEPESPAVLDFEIEPARDFAPERTKGANVYEAVAGHVAELRRGKRKVVLASYSVGARERLKGLLAEHGLDKTELADEWQQAPGVAAA